MLFQLKKDDYNHLHKAFYLNTNLNLIDSDVEDDEIDFSMPFSGIFRLFNNVSLIIDCYV